MPHSPAEKKRVLTRVRRLRGQLDALERALEAGTDCAPILQQIAAIRGATTGLMNEVLEGHIRETYPTPTDGDRDAQVDDLIGLLNRYLK